MDIKNIKLSGSLSDDAAKNLLASQLTRLSNDFSPESRPVIAEWLDRLVRQLWDHLSDIPKPDVRLQSLSMMLAKKVDKAKAVVSLLQSHDLADRPSLLTDLLTLL